LPTASAFGRKALGQVDDRDHVQLDRPQLGLEIRLTREVAMDPSAGVVHEEIGRAMAAAHALVQPLRARGIGQIGHDHRHLARAVGLKLARRLLQLGPVIGGDDQRVPSFAKRRASASPMPLDAPVTSATPFVRTMTPPWRCNEHDAWCAPPDRNGRSSLRFHRCASGLLPHRNQL
jgi:hypothetical protein